MTLRAWLLTRAYEWTEGPYALLCRHRVSWDLSASRLLEFPRHTLGFALGTYLTDKGFELIDKRESHDLAHLLTGTDTDVVSEVALQWLLLGNGKRTLYLFLTCLAGCIILPEHSVTFFRAYRRGCRLEVFHNWDWLRLLHGPVPVLAERNRSSAEHPHRAVRPRQFRGLARSAQSAFHPVGVERLDQVVPHTREFLE